MISTFSSFFDLVLSPTYWTGVWHKGLAGLDQIRLNKIKLNFIAIVQSTRTETMKWI